MIDFYKKADKKRRGELEFVPERIEEKVMLLLFPRKTKKAKPRQNAPVVQRVRECVSASPRRAFCDAYYECV